MRVFEVMNENVPTVTPHTTVEDARAIMQSAGVQYLVVTATHRQIAGVVSATDLRRAASPNTPVAEVMTSRVVSVARNDTVRKAANLMEGRTIGCLPVTDAGRLAGIVTIADLLRIVGKGVARPEPKRRRVENHRVPHRKMHVASGRW
jgi:CBS domain-containing protein